MLSAGGEGGDARSGDHAERAGTVAGWRVRVKPAGPRPVFSFESEWFHGGFCGYHIRVCGTLSGRRGAADGGDHPGQRGTRPLWAQKGQSGLYAAERKILRSVEAVLCASYPAWGDGPGFDGAGTPQYGRGLCEALYVPAGVRAIPGGLRAGRGEGESGPVSDFRAHVL